MEQRISGRKQKNVFWIGAAGVLGAGLLAAWLATGKKGPGEEDRQIYEQAAAMQEQVDKLGFTDFRLEDYPVVMYDGKKDYVFYQGEIKERAPVLETFAGTAYPVEDHFEVIVPTAEQLDKLLSLAGGVEGMVSGSGYGAEEQKAILWHEAFHAYQLTNYAILGEKVTPGEMRQEIERNKEGQGKNSNVGQKQEESDRVGEGQTQETIFDEEWIVREVDRKEEVRSQVEEELKLLEDAAKLSLQTEKKNAENPASAAEKEEQENPENLEKLKKMISDYSESRRQRLAEMPDEAAEAEIRCELTEGTAYYVESKVYRLLAGEKGYEEHYLDGIGGFEGGRGKYYRTGMAKCLILDRLALDWKEDFDFTRGLDEVLADYL